MCRSNALYKKLTDKTVLSEFFAPVVTALTKVRYSNERFLSLPMEPYLLFGCIRHLKSLSTMRELIQHFFHQIEEDEIPVPRSTYSDALNSNYRTTVLQSAVAELAEKAPDILPDRLKNIKELGNRPIYAFDGTYSEESVHYKRITPKNGGKDNPKGHMMLTAFDLRIGVPIGVATETSSRHETKVLASEFDVEGGILRKRNAIFVVDRGFVNAPLWDIHKKKYGQTSITRWKEGLVILSDTKRNVQATRINEGVLVDEDVQLKASKQPWRRITYKAPDGNELIFLTNELILEPGIIAFLYLRRWDEEKCFDMWKNDLSCQKAWSKSDNGILQQALLAVMTTLLVHMFSHKHKTIFGVDDEKSLKKQDALIKKQSTKNGHRVPWYREFFRATSKISKQIFRFLKECFLKKSSQRLYERELKPLFMGWL